MAAGDVINEVTSLGPGGIRNFQPAAGVEIVLTSFAYQGTSSNTISFNLYDGTNQAAIFQNLNLNDNVGIQTKTGITNSVYLRYINGHGTGTRVLGFSGIQTK